MTVDVVVEEMRTHAGRLDSISQSGQDAVSAGQSVSANGDAFGILCSFIGEALNPVEEAGVQISKAACGTVSSMANGVRTSATIFENADGAVQEVFDWLRG